jgi:hypothetical protein
MEIYIVTSKDIIGAFQRNFKEFKVDLGKSFTAVSDDKTQNNKTIINIKDGFVERFINETGSFCYKMGTAGLLQFYTFPGIDQQIWIYARDEKMVVPCKRGTNINTTFLGSILLELENRLKVGNPNSLNTAVENYYKKKTSVGTTETN